MPAWRTRRAERGFTLTELMVVVVLIGVLAMIGVAAFRKRVTASKATEVTTVIGALRAGEEAYKGENQEYLDISDPNAWYPSATFNSDAISWSANFGTHVDGPGFQALNAPITQSVQYRYLVNAGSAGDTMPSPTGVTLPTWPTPSDPWYVIIARANVDGDSVFSTAVATSFNHEINVTNEGE
ncbi:MAG: type II secretion system GspH family protein [Myxococcota bacterium]|nr:type II secretion system GspH family protein [Myxococcota bacterium]